MSDPFVNVLTMVPAVCQRCRKTNLNGLTMEDGAWVICDSCQPPSPIEVAVQAERDRIMRIAESIKRKYEPGSTATVALTALQEHVLTKRTG